jgi:CMP-N,N'-diacetyllegionaminic acid synthase
MIRGQSLTAIVPVRGGSKGIPGKNLYRLGRDTLLERTIKVAKLCRYVDRIIVTTDDPGMFSIADSYGVAAPTLRPAHLASDSARTIDVVLYVMESAKIESGYILLLQVTSPLRTLMDLNDFCRTFEQADDSIDAIVSLVRHDSPHPDKIQKVESGLVVSYTGQESMVARQLLPQVYALNGAFYLTRSEIIQKQRTFMPKMTIPYLMPEERSINLDTEVDLFLLECLIEKGRVQIEEY